MRKRDALKLHNRDQVKVRGSDGQWHSAYVLGTPFERPDGRVWVPVMSSKDGFLPFVDHADVR
jgi:hypothetical protein